MKLNNIKNKIKEYFFTNPTARLRVRQIEREIKSPLPSVIRYSKELEKENILKVLDVSGIKFYTADRSSEAFLIEKKLFNIKRISDSGMIDYLKHEYSNPTMVVFGSYSRGEDIEKSDIDLYIETEKKHDFKLDKFEKYLKRRIQVFNYSNISKVSNPQLSNNIINGITLNGFLEVFK